MAYILVKDSAGNEKAIQVASGDGSTGSPFVSGVQVLAGTAAFGKLAANSGVIIGDVNISASQTIGLAAGSAVIGHVIVDSGTISTVTNLSQLGGAAVPIGAGLEATAIRVTLPTDGTGVVKLGAGSAVVGHFIVDSGTVTTVSTVTNLSQLGGAAVPIGAGLEATAIRVTLPTDGTGVVKLGAGSAVVGHFIVDSGTVTTVSTVTNLSQLGGAAVPIGAGLEATAIRVTLPTDGTGVVKLGAGSAVVGHFIVDSGTITTVSTVTTITNVVHIDDNSGSLTIDGNVGTLPLTSGGLSAYTALSAGAVLTAQIKGSAGQIYGIEVFNTNASARFVRLYNQTGAPGSGDAANIIWRGFIPGNATGTGFVVRWPHGLACATGIGIRASAAVADNDTTVLGTNDLTFNVSYK